MEVLDGCWQNEERNPNIEFSSEHKTLLWIPIQARVICLEKEDRAETIGSPNYPVHL